MTLYAEIFTNDFSILLGTSTGNIALGDTYTDRLILSGLAERISSR